MEITLRRSIPGDLDTFFRIQADDEAIRMAAFTAKDPYDREAYLAKFRRLLQDPSVHMQTILLGDTIIGSVSKFVMEGEAEITYALDKAYWGRGLATLALQRFLQEEPVRPINGRVAFDNMGSQRVLEKAGFRRTGTDRGFANARGQEIEEFLFRLD